MKDKRGITLISLVVMISIILILASIGTYSGIKVIQLSKLTAFTTELKIMQAQINDIYEKNNNSEEYGEPISGDENREKQAEKVFSELEKEPIIIDKSGYRYWSKQTIKQLGIEGVEQDFFVNLEKRSVVSYQGLEYEGKVYYTLSQFPKGLYNVEHTKNNQVGERPTFDAKIEIIDNNKWRITISNIEYAGYTSKWQIRYQLGEENWKESENLSFIVNEQGIYKIKVVNNEIESEEKEVVAIGAYEKEGLILHYDAINNLAEGEDKHSLTTTIWKDLSGNGNDGILSGFNHTEESGWKEKGLKFDGIDDIVKTNEKFDFSSFQAGVPFSYGATITIKDISQQWSGILTNMTVWQQGGFNIQYGSVQRIAIGMGQYLNSTTIPTENTTYNIYGVYDGSLMKLYVNGTLEGSMQYDVKAGSKAITIGYFYDIPSLPMNGEILNIKVYNKVLTEEQITKNFNIDKLRFNIEEESHKNLE